MAKRIFKVIGIVLASVLGLAGGIVGVLAIMGKFKTPVVYPKQLVFAEPEMTIVDNGEYDSTLKLSSGENGIYYFTLVGESGKEQEVTKKDCLLTITSGANLIQLCDENGDTSTIDKVNGKYKIKCNERTYFRLKQIENEKLTGTTYGKVSLKAEDERMMTSTGNNGLTIWVDRMVKSIALNESQMQPNSVENFMENNKAGRQYTVGLEEGLAFDAVSSPIYALNPISKENYSGKIVEYYYFKPGVMTDWAYIDKNNLQDYPFLTYNQEEDMLYFKADTTDLAGQTYQFRVAVFATYAARERYLASIEGATDDISNLDRMTEMVWSRFNVVVKSTKITSIGSETANIDLSLFETNNNLIMNSNSDGFKNLRLYMIGAGTRTYLRFDEADFDLRTINLLKDPQTDAIVDINTVWFKSYLASDFSSGNVDVLNLNSKVGNTFIDFFVYDATRQAYRLATEQEFDYTAAHIADTRGENRSFNISVKSLPNLDDGLQLVIGVMVVNNTGEYYFTSIDVSVVENDLDFAYVDELQERTLTINYVKDRIGNYTANPEWLDFENLVAVNSGSYRACVFVTPKTETGEYDIEVLPNIVYTKDINGEAKQYVLVGYFEAGKFINRVKAKDGAKNVSTKLYLLQLKNSYETNFTDETGDATEQYINSIFTQTTFNTETNQLVKIFTYDEDTNYTIGKEDNENQPDIVLNGDKGERFVSDSKMAVINIKYEIPDDIKFETFKNDSRNDLVTEANKRINLVAGFDYTVTLSTNVKNMLKNLYYANVDNIESFKQYLSVLVLDNNDNIVESDSMVNIVDAVLNDADEDSNPTIVITFSINENANSAALTNPRTYKLRFVYGEVCVDSNLIYVVTDKPNNITLAFVTAGQDEDGQETRTINSVELGNAVMNIQIGCDTSAQGYTYSYTLNNKANGSLIYAYEQDQFTLNSNNVELTDVPSFYVSPDYRDTRGDNNEILYSIAGIGYVTDLASLPVGNYDLVVSTYGDISRVLSVVVSAPTDKNLASYFTYNDDISSVTVKDETTYKLNYGNPEAVKGVGYGFVTTSENDAKLTTYLPGLLNINVLGFNFSGSENLELITQRDETNNTIGYKLKTVVNEGEGEDVLTIARDADGDWKFDRLKFINTRLTISLAVKMDTFADAISWQITFESSRQIDMNKAWTDIYANTTIQLFENRTNSNEEFKTNALFQITNNTAQALSCNIYALNSNGVYDRTINLGGENITDGTLALAAGTYLVEFLDNSNELLETFSNIVVKPNYFVTWKAESLTSENTNYSVSDLLSIQQYSATNKSNKVYGSEITNLIYNSEDLVELTDYAGFTLQSAQKSSDGAQLVVLSNGVVNVGYIKDLNNAIKCNLTLLHNGNKVGESHDIDVVNKYLAEIKNANFMVNRDNLTNGVSLKEKNSTGDGNNTVTNASVSVSIDSKYTLAENVVTKNISKNTIVTATYTFNFEGREYVYSTEITLLPYVPTTKSNSNNTEVYSQNNQFDIINSIFDFNYDETTGVLNNDKIKNIYIDKVLLNGEEYYDCFTIGETIKGVGYTLSGASASNTKFVTPIGAINGDSQYITIRYHIEYMDGVSYTYEHTLQIKNYLSVEAQYPFSDKTTNSQVYMVAVDGKVDDVIAYGNKLGENKYTNRGNNIFGFESGLNYEPVTIQQVVDLDADASLDVNRALIKNLAQNGETILSGVESVELVAFESNQNARYYVNSNSISINGTIITFNASETFSAGSSAYFLFKINLTSGNYGFYLVRLYKQTGNFAGITLKDVVNEVEASNAIDIAPKWSTIFSDNKSLQEIYGISTSQDSEWNSIKKNIHYYLLSIKANGNTSVGAFDFEGINSTETENMFESKQYKEILINQDSFIISNPNKFVQIKLGLVYADDNRTFYLGSYTTSISVTGNLNISNSENPNGLLNKTDKFGRYTATLADLTPKSILAADAADVDVKIESVSLTGTTASKFDCEYNDDSAGAHAGVKITPKGNTTNIVEINGANIVVNKFITTDLTFTVEFNVAGATIVVDFNLDATIVDQIGNVVLGSFDTSTGFNTNLDLNSRIGNYVGAIDYADTFAEGLKGEYDAATKTVDYSNTQTTKTNQGVATLTLNDLFDVDTAQTVVRDINVTIYPAYHVEQGIGGGTETSPYQAETIANNFASAIGSKAKVTKTENSNLGYNTYILQNGNVGGLKIYVKAGTTLKFTAGTITDGSVEGESCAKYVVSSVDENGNGSLLAADGKIDIEQTAEINFVHMAQSKTILLTINLLAGEEEIYNRNDSSKALTINLFVTLPATYTNLKANYTVKNSNHDNFITNQNKENILAYLFSNAYDEATIANENDIYSSIRMSLVAGVDAQGKDNVVETFNAEKMGFFDKNNPNHLELVLGDSLRYESNALNGDYNLVVGSVSSTTQTWLRLNNAAGLESEAYIINILTEADKLVYQADSEDQTYLTNHSNWNDANGQYASIVIKDNDKDAGFDYSTTNTQNKIAKIYDVRNNSFKIVGKTATINGNNATIKLSQATDDNGVEIEGSYMLNVTQGQISYTLAIYRNEYREILFNLTRGVNSDLCENLVVSFDIYTNSGLVCEGFTMNIFNYNIAANKTEFYATETFELKDLFEITSNSTNTSVDDISYNLILNTSYYVIDGNKVYITSNSNNLFEYNTSNSTITTYQVPEQVQLNAFIQVNRANQIVDVVESVITIKRNIQFMVNGEAAAPGSQFSTDYNLVSSATYTDSKITGFIPTSLIDTLGLTLNYVKNGVSITIRPDITTIAVSQVEVADYTGNVVSNYVELDSSYNLNFKRDFTGTVTISLAYKTNSGYFRQYWDINVTGLQTLAYANNPTYPLVDNGVSYTSGKSVDIVNPSTSNNPAIVSTSNVESNKVDYRIKAEYTIIDLATFNSYVDMDYLLNNNTFASATTVTGYDGSADLDNVVIKTTLPLVPQSKADDPVDYYVVYRIQYKYAGEEIQPYFAIYKVRNVATITLAPNVSTAINVDDNTTNAIYSNKKLNLFYYVETFGTTETGLTTLQYLGQNKFKLNETEYDQTTYSIVDNVLTIGEYVFDYVSAVPTVKIGTGNNIARTSITTYLLDGTTTKTMFNSDYANTLRFKDFVDNISKISINDVDYLCTEEENRLTNENGIITLNLADKILFKNSAETQLKIYLKGSGQPIDAFDVSLSGNNSITPKGSLWLSQIFQDGGYKTDYQITGISTSAPEANWFKGNGLTVKKLEAVSTFTIVTGATSKTYTIYEVSVEGSGDLGIYEVNANYKFMVADDTTIYAVDYLSRGESNCFRVQYEEGKDSTINLLQSVKKYYNNEEGALTGEPIEGLTITGVDGFGYSISTDDISAVTITEQTLFKAKQDNKDSTYILAKLALSQSDLVAVVRFDLPELTYLVNYAPTTDEDGTNYVEFDISSVENNIDNCRNVLVYDESNSTYISLNDLYQIVMNTETLTKYKDANADATYMKVNYRLTYTKTDSSGVENQVEVNFAVRWKLSAD